jgi:hypothetical protein
MEKIASTAQANRRHSLRRKPRGSVRVECRLGLLGLGRNLASTTLDISDSGARLIVTQALDFDREVEVVLTGYGMNKPIKRSAHTRWQVKLDDGRFCIGLEFQKRLDYRDLQTLASPS